MSGIADDIEKYGSEFDDGADDPPREVRCLDCQSEDVYWAKDSTGRWSLYNFNSRKHVCNSNIVSAVRLGAFEDES